jgi:chromosome partitioning protein
MKNSNGSKNNKNSENIMYNKSSKSSKNSKKGKNIVEKEKLPKVITVAAQKGGVGKSTIACNLAVCFAKDGYAVELIDADTQGSSMIFRSIRSEKSVDDFVGSANTTKTIFKDIDKKKGYEVIVIDTGGRDSGVMRNAIMAASYGMLIVPFVASQFDLSALTDTLNVLAEARALDINIPAFVLYNRVDAGRRVTKDAKGVLGELGKEYQIGVFKSVLGNRNDFIASIAEGEGAIEYKSRNGKAKAEMEGLFSEIKKLLEGK